MNTSRIAAGNGYTLVEMMVSLAIVTIVIAGATAGWVFLARAERVNSVQTELDMDVRKSMEQIKRDLRLSALDKMVFYPSGPGPYTAVSFPMARDDNGDGLIEMMPNGTNILWDSTVIYHVWTGTPNRLLKTVFDPRDNSLTDTQRMEQLASVALNGNGKSTYGAANAKTYKIFENLFTWKIWPKSASYDAYYPTLSRDPSATFGSILLSPGSHAFKFTVSGKNTNSVGYQVGVDTLTVSPCGAEREGEAQLPASGQTGATAVANYPAGSWSGNSQLLFPATGSNATFTLTMDNDRWEETNFRGEGALCDKTLVEYDSSLKDYIVRLEGLGNAWTAEGQTGDSAPVSDNSDSMANCAVRIPIRGRNLLNNGGTIQFNGMYHYVLFEASTNLSLNIQAAYIAEAADQANYTMDAASAGTPLYFWSGGSYSQTGIEIGRGGSAWGRTQLPYPVDATKTYLVTMLVQNEHGATKQWRETHAGAPGSYVIPNSASPTAADAQAANWSSKPAYTTNRLFSVSTLYTVYPSNATFTSQFFDTKMTAPPYTTMSWNSDKPGGTSLKMKVRTGDLDNYSDMPAWSNVTAVTVSPAAITAGNKRYIQFQAILDPDSSGYNTPKLKDVTIRWTGPSKIVDIGATMTQGPNYGIVDLTVDGATPSKGLRVDLSIYETILGWSTGKVVTSSMTAEVQPRNTGK